jgi:hypothetical protein
MVGATFSVAATAQVIRAKKSITAVGNASVSTTQSKFGGTSLNFDGTGDYITLSYSDSIGKWNQSTGYTLEYWIRLTSLAGTSYPDGATYELPSGYGNHNPTDNVNYWSFGPIDSGNVVFFYYNGGKVTTQTSGVTISTGTWYHLAFVYDGSSGYKIFVDGTERASGTVSGTPQFNSSYPITHGAAASPAQYINGWTDELRVSNIARYTTTFTPSTTPFVNDANTVLLIHADGTNGSTALYDDNGQRSQNSIIANGNAQTDFAQSKFGSSSALFDGTGDYLLVSKDTDLTDFTIEFWYRANTLPGSGLVPLVSFNNTLMYIGYSGANTVYDFYNGGSRVTLNAVTINTGTWYHAAFVRSGSSVTVYHNGTSVTTGTWGTAIDWGTYGPEIGKYSTYYLNGWMDEIRISNSARYTGNFSVATAPFTNDSNTLLLLHMNAYDGATVFTDDNQNASYTPLAELTDDSSTELLLHMNGSAGGTTFTDDNSTGRTAKTITRYTVTTETAQKKFGTASMLGSTSGAYGLVVTGTNNLLQWYNADFCAEAWIYPTSYTSISGGTYGGIPTGKVIGNMARAGGGNYWGFGPTSTGALSWYMWDPSIGSRGFVTTSTPITLNTWHHIAVQHDLGRKVLTIFCNGVKLDEWAWTYNANVTSDNTTGLAIGVYDSVGFPGYIDDVRVSRCLRY